MKTVIVNLGLRLCGAMILIVLPMSGCTSSKGAASAGAANSSAPLALPSPSPTDAAGWKVQTQSSADGALVVTQRTMPDDQQQAARNRYQLTELRSVPVDTRYNAQVFAITAETDLTKVHEFYVAPKLFAYGSTTTGRIAPEGNADGTTSISFPMILTDGTQDTIVSAAGGSSVVPPDSVRVQDLAGLRADLANRFGTGPTLAVLPGCPKKIIIKVNDTEYDATMEAMVGADYCQINRRFNATIRLSPDKAQYVLQQALYAGAVEVQAVYETRVAFISSQFSLSFNKKKMFSQLAAELQMNAGIVADIDARAKITDILKSESMQISMVGDANSDIQKIIQQAIDLFFVSYTPITPTEQQACDGQAFLCLRLNYNKSDESDNFTASWTQTSSAQVGENYVTWTILQPIQDKIIQVGALGSSYPLRNDGKATETGLIAHAGDIIQFTPTRAAVIRKTLATTHRESHPTCWMEGLVQLKNRAAYVVEPAHYFDCQTEWPRGEHECQKNCYIEDRWYDVTDYDDGALFHTEIVDQPVGKIPELFSGLVMRFNWVQGGQNHQVDCPFNQLDQDGYGSRMKVTLNNQNGCPVPSDSSVDLNVSLINQIDNPQGPAMRGERIVDWLGRVKADNVSSYNYVSQVDLEMDVMMRGTSVGSSGSGGAAL